MFHLFHHPGSIAEPGLQHVGGHARVDKRTKNLTRRLREGEIAIINHADIDRVAAEALVACKPAAVLNAAASTTGRFPNLGPGIIVDAGIPLLDNLGVDIMGVKEGSIVDVDMATGEVTVNGEAHAGGTILTPDLVEQHMEAARAGLTEQMTAFAENTLAYMHEEQDLIFDGTGVPAIMTKIDGRHVLIVVRGYNYKEDLDVLRPYIAEYHPVTIGVDGGADALLEAGLKLDIILGDMDSVTDKALTHGAEIIVHAYKDGRAPGAKRLDDLGVPYVLFPAAGTSEDVAMLLADDKGASLIVAVGTHMTLIEFLDKGREGMSSTFLTRLRVGSKLVDAKGVSRLYRRGVTNWQLVALTAAALLTMVVAIWATPAGKILLGLIGSRFHDFDIWVRGIFS